MNMHYIDDPTSPPYDAVVVLCGGLRKVGTKYEPTTFEDGDEFGMLGGFVRVIAAKELYWQGRSPRFLFSTGVSAKQIEKFGQDVPPESHIYRDTFLTAINADSRKDTVARTAPEIFLEDLSVNTVDNLEKTIAICEHYHWQRVAIVSSAYHIPRIQKPYSG